MYCRSASGHTAPLTALSRDAVSLPVWATGFRHNFYWVKHPCYNSQPLSYSYHILWWPGMCSHQCVWVSKYWYHCCSNLDLSSGSMYHSFLNNYVHKCSIWLVSEKDSEKDMDLWLSLPADPPTWTTISPELAMQQLQSKSGAHLASLTSYIQFLQPWVWSWCGLKIITDTWKTFCDTETICSTIKYYLKV